jgi:DnaK suppressor protein
LQQRFRHEQRESNRARDAIAFHRDSYMKSQSRTPRSKLHKPPAAASRTAKFAHEAKPRNGSKVPAKSSAKTNGHGKALVQGGAKAAASKSLLAKAGPSKAQTPLNKLPKKAAPIASNGKTKQGKKSGSVAKAKSANGSAAIARLKKVEVKTAAVAASASIDGAAKSTARRGRSARIEVKQPEPKSRGVAVPPVNGRAQNGKATSKTNGAGPHRANGANKNGAKAPMTELPGDYRPSDSEPFMGEMHRLYFRRKLSAWRDEILRSTKETLQSLHDDQAHYADIADRATSESDKALELRARDRQRKLIAKIEAAIERIDRGTYGYCDETGEPIAVRRLDARPIATLSIEAQERHERRERVYRDD